MNKRVVEKKPALPVAARPSAAIRKNIAPGRGRAASAGNRLGNPANAGKLKTGGGVMVNSKEAKKAAKKAKKEKKVKY